MSRPIDQALPAPRWYSLPRGSRRRAVTIGVLGVIVVVSAWYALSDGLNVVNPLLLPSPGKVLFRFVDLLHAPYQGHTLIGHALVSTKLVLLGWALGALVGLPVGILMGWNRWIRAAVSPLFQLLRPIPPIAWIPLAILWFGLGDPARIYVVWLAAVVPWVLNSFEAVRSIDSLLIAAARTLGAPPRTILAEIVIPTSIPVLIGGARIALGNAWMTLIAAELLAASSGLGFVALNARRTLDPDIMLVAMGSIGLLGLVFTALLSMLERAASKHRPAREAEQ